ncbi:MAG: HypC/HybG/HupF family hydrogenase formation chaperone [Ruminiclostridium sp.]|nr:HypC/HybG/HupF family hydrogenase formation chaperone [Ruminiclostridium sp.]
MCLAVPAKVIEIFNDKTAIVDILSVQQRTNISLVDVMEGDWILIHAGVAINKIDRQMAEETLKILKELEIDKNESE